MKGNSLVNEILADITNRIADDGCKIGGQGSKKEIYGKKIYVLFAGCNSQLDPIMSELRQLKRYGYQLVIVLSREVEKKLGKEPFQKGVHPLRILTEDDQADDGEWIEEMEFLIVPTLAQSTAAKLRQGLQDTIDTFLLWQALWVGKPVLVNQQEILIPEGKPSKNPVLTRIVNENLSFLKEVGIGFMEDHGYLNRIMALSSGGTQVNEALNSLSDQGDKRVITEKDILEAVGKTDRICIHKNSIVTPLALDTARDKKIMVIRG